jgi:DNA-binding MarR family transcriptional regulator
MKKQADRNRRKSPGKAAPAAATTERKGRRKTFKPFDPALDLGLLLQLTGFAVRRAQLRVFSRFARSVGDKSVTPQRFSMLEVIGANPGLQQSQLAGVLGLSRPAATVTIDYWQARHCVERRSDPKDRRSNGIYITPQGREVLEELEAQVLAHDRDLTARLTAGQIRQLCQLLEKIYSG